MKFIITNLFVNPETLFDRPLRKIPFFSIGEDKDEVANKHFPKRSIKETKMRLPKTNFRKVLTILLLLFCIKTQAQSDSAMWQSITASRGNFSFTMPTQSQGIIDSADALAYYATADSAIGFSAVYVTNFSFDSIPDYDSFTVHLSDGSSPLYAMANYMAFETNGTMVQSEQNSVPNHPEIKAITVGVKYVMIDTTMPTYAFYKMYYWSNKLLTFSITAQEEDLNNLIADKNRFFNSVVIQ